MTKYNPIMETPEATVVAEYSSVAEKSVAYQSEASLESAFIGQLQKQAYEYLPVKSEPELIANLKIQLERLNSVKFSDSEWKRFFINEIANKNDGIVEKTRKIQIKDTAISFKFDDGTSQNIRLLDKRNIHNNNLQVINQYETESGNHPNRYDVTILVNGLPMVHVELKRRGVNIREAFNQIDRYQRDSFWADSGLFEYIQIFVISNGTYTKYYSNTTRDQHIREFASSNNRSTKKTSNSFEFTCWWADASNQPITDLVDFTKTFLAKHTILNILTKYCVLTCDNLLLVMRPYQIVAAERILNQIEIAHNYKLQGTIKAGGYIWHTTGSGKTLTSFKTAQLASQLDYIDKVLFVVDRKDLDYQTMREYDRFQKGAANGNRNTKVLEKQLYSDAPDQKVIVTTIQKLDNFIKRNQGEEVMSKQIVMIFDECHRSQFGDMGKSIRKHFKNYYMFGFTGTPIFAANASTAGQPDFKTTEQTFGRQLHSYTIVNAINDKNVLPFRVAYIKTIQQKDDIADEKVLGIDENSAWMAPGRISIVVKYILEHFNQKTLRNVGSYEFNKLINVNEMVRSRNNGNAHKERLRLRGFNSIFAVSSTEAAQKYYQEFKRQQADIPEGRRLRIATIFSYSPNEANDGDASNGFLSDENSDGTEGLDQVSRDFLDSAIDDYNAMFGTQYDTSSEGFQSYYKDVSLRMKNRDLDLLIVVNMFLTGFDATTLNTLWVDKNLRMHGLIQAYSRTNRILNSVKTYGNIVSFRNLQRATDEALALFGDKDASGIVLLRSFNDYFNGYEQNGRHIKGYVELVDRLRTEFPVGGQIIGEENQKEFVKLFGNILRARNILTSFDEFAELDMLAPRELQDQQSRYIEMYDRIRPNPAERESIADDVVFEMELIREVDINIDYILALIEKYHETNQQDRDIKINIDKAIESSLELRNKKDLIEKFIATLGDSTSDVFSDWQEFIKGEKARELDKIIDEEHLNKEKTYEFMRRAFASGEIRESGTDITKILPPVSFFNPDARRPAMRRRVLAKLRSFFDRFFAIADE